MSVIVECVCRCGMWDITFRRLDSWQLGDRNVDMNNVVEHAITGGGVALLFFGIGWTWQLLGYLNRKLFITDPPASKAKAASGPSPQATQRP